MTRTSRTVATLVALVVLAAACGGAGDAGGDGEATGAGDGGGATQPDDRAEITLALDWVPNTGHYWYFVAQENGYFEEAGIEVQHQVPDSATTSIKMASLGQADIGLAFGADAVNARDQGLPIRIVNTIAATFPLGMMAFSDEVSDFTDVKGGTVGVLATDFDQVCFRRQLEAHGMSEDDVSIIDPGFNLVPPLLSGQADMVSAGDSFEGVIAREESGRSITFFPHSDVCPETAFYMVANEAWMESNGDTLLAFNTAVTEALKWAVEHPEEARDIFVSLYPDYEPELELKMWDHTIGAMWCNDVAREHGFGYSDAAQWQAMIDLMAEVEAIAESFPADELITNDYLPDPLVTSEVCEQVG